MKLPGTSGSTASVETRPCSFIKFKSLLTLSSLETHLPLLPGLVGVSLSSKVMGYFDNCDLDERYSTFRQNCGPAGSRYVVMDWDQRRTIAVSTSWEERDEDFIFEALYELEEDLPIDALSIDIADNGRLLSSHSDLQRDRTMIPYYPPVTEFPTGLHMVRRSHLTEVDRLGLQVDLTTYESPSGQKKEVAFKYYMNESNVPMFWHEVNLTLRLPKHPNIVPFDALVIDHLDGNNLVVGFTTTFTPGGTLQKNKSRVFKLKYLKQLTKVVDFLNLRLGIVHGDICPWNLLINSETDNLQVFDFNCAAKLGWEGDIKNKNVFKYDVARNDVKLVVFTLYEIITRDQHFREDYYPIKSDMSVALEMDKWEQHPEVRLDSPVSDYRQVLEKWVNIRKKVDQEITHFTQAPDALDWPLLPELPFTPLAGAMFRQYAQMRQEMALRGANFLKWQRPGSYQLPLPPGQRLLATGEIVHDGGGRKTRSGHVTGGRVSGRAS